MAPEDEQPQVRVVDRRWWVRGETGAVDEQPSLKPTYVEDLEQRLNDVTVQLQAALAERRRGTDDIEQIRGRLRRESAREIERARRGVLTDFLEVLDNLERALAAGHETGSETDSRGITRGVELVRDLFVAKLGALGVQRIAAAGQPFDAIRHDAVSVAPVDPRQDGMVVAVIREGYAMGDEILRPASVVVGKSADSQ
jgi:molecular chaperone GrpE